MTDRELDILKKSLVILRDFPTQVYLISASGYITMYYRCIETLAEISVERESTYITEKIDESPDISFEEVDQYIKSNRKEVSFLSFFASKVLGLTVNFISAGGNTSSQIKNKLVRISEISSVLLMAVEHPGLQELITQSKREYNKNSGASGH